MVRKLLGRKDVIFMLSIKIANVVPLSNIQLLVFFENGVIKKFDVARA